MSFYYKIPICGTSWTIAEYQDCAAAFWGRDRTPELSEWIAARFGVVPALLNSGRSALEVALRRIAAENGSARSKSVLVPSLVCAAVPRKVAAAGMRPVFYDVTDAMLPSVRSAQEAIEADTVAVIYPYLYGKVGGVREMASFARQRGIRLVEDCAAAFLLTDETGQLAGRTGDFAVFSFQEGKTLVAGSGGALIDRTRSEPFVPRSWSWLDQQRLGLAKFSFIIRKVEKHIGYALEKAFGRLGPSFADRLQEEIYAMSPADARLVLRQVSRWPELQARKIEIIQRYARNLAGSVLRLPQVERADGYIGRLFVQYPEAVVERRSTGQYESAVVRALQRKGVQTQLPYYPAHLLEEFAPAYSGLPLPRTETLFRSLIEVPTQARLKPSQIDYVCECLLETAKVWDS